jgi:hypothetical protein
MEIHLYKPLNDIFGDLTLNIIATFLGLLAIFYLLRPKLKISKELVFNTSGYLRVKVVNVSTLGLVPIHSIKAEMLFYKETENGNRTTLTIPLKKNEVFKIQRCFNAKPADYSYIFKTVDKWMVGDKEKTTEDILKSQKYDGLIFRIMVTNTFSNMTRIFEQRYQSEAIQRDFETGKSIKIKQ